MIYKNTTLATSKQRNFLRKELMIMKKVIISMSLMVMSLMMFSQVKIAHINIQELLSEMPEMKVVKGELDKLQKSYASNIQTSMKELQSKATTYQNEANLLSQEELQSRSTEFKKKAEELQTMESNIQQARQTASQDLQKKQQELLKPVMKKAQNAIDKIAEEKGIKYVLDSSPGGTVIVAKGLDISSFVKRDLGF